MDLEKVNKDCEFIQTILREAFPNFLIQINVQRILGCGLSASCSLMSPTRKRRLMGFWKTPASWASH